MSFGEISPKIRASTLITGNTSGSNVVVGAPVLSGGANITLSGTGNTIVISAAAGGAGTLNSSAVGNTTGSTSSTSFGSLESISGAGGASVGFSGQTMIVSAPATSALSFVAAGNTTGSTSSTTFQNAFTISGSGGDSVGFSGQTIIISGGAAAAGFTLSNSYWPPGIANSSIGGLALASGNLYVQYIPVNNNLSISRGALIISVSPQTSAGASSGSWSATIGMGIYTRNGTSYSTVLTSSAALSTTWQSNTNSQFVTGFKLVTVPLATLLTPNEYWLLVNMSTATGGQLSATQSIGVFSQAGAGQNFTNFGTSIPATGNAIIYGVGTTTTSSFTLPANLGFITTGGAGSISANILVQLNNYTLW